MTEDASSDAFSITFKWDAQLLKIRDDYFNLPEADAMEGQSGLVVAIFAGIIIVCTAALWILESQGIAPHRGAVMFFAGAFLAGLISIWTVSKMLGDALGKLDQWEQDAKDSAISEKATQLDFGSDGFTETSEHHLSLIHI